MPETAPPATMLLLPSMLATLLSASAIFLSSNCCVILEINRFYTNM
jgi:hypothetical protein